MQFSEMVQWVIRDTKRPDKLLQIKDAVNAAIEHFSLSATFAADLVEATQVISATVYAQSIDVTTLTRFRKLKYLNRPGQRGYIKWIDSQNVYDSNGCEELDRWYRAGNNIVFKMRTLSATLDIAYYTYPPRLVLDTATHWMMDVTPTMVHDRACMRIFDDIGEGAEARSKERSGDKIFFVAKEDLEDSAEHRAAA